MAKYTTYFNDSKVIVVSRYAGKSVRGVAKCDPKDQFNGVYGERLATARCDVKVSEKRQRRAAELATAAAQDLIKAQARLDKMMAYLREATDDFDAAQKALAEIEAEAGVTR